MDSSRRAVETYWRSRMIDAATSDEDKVTPVYKLEEICELLRSSHVSIVKEVSEFVFKRLEHRSPIVKQKALRLIKYAVGKSGTEFRREMQRNSVAVRQLFHYKGQVDPLKGDALNKAVRDTAHEAISAIFSEDDSKLQPAENLNRRIEGFGNTNFEMPSDDKKSFLSEVVGIGSATIKQGLNSFTQAQSLRKNDTGSYKSPTLRRSLTTEIDYPDRYDRVEHHNESQGTSRFSKNAISGPWRQDLKVKQPETTNGDSISSSSESKTREERLLETIVTSGGVRLQPTRDVLQVFLVEASKLDAFALGHAIESKLQSPLWQVRMKAVCVLEAILRKKDEQFSTIASYFSENIDSVVRCSESPQSSLREKATKVLGLLDRDQTGSKLGHLEKPVKAETVVEVPDLIDTGDIDDLLGTEDSVNLQGDQSVANPTSTTNLMEDLLGDGLGAGVSTSEQKNDDDPFADVSFHTGNDKEHVADLFSAASDFSTAKTKNEAELFDIFGSNTDLPLKQENPGKDVKPGASDKHVVDKPGASDFSTAKTKNEPELFDIFGSNTDLPLKQENPGKDVNDLMAGFSINENASFLKQTGATFGSVTETIFSNTPINPSSQGSNDVLNGILGSQAAGMNANTLFPLGHTPYNLSSGVTFSPAFPSQPMNYGAMGSLFAQQQFLATMSNFQQLGNFQSQNGGLSHAAGTKADGYSSPLPDIFNPAIPAQIPSSMVNSSKKEETRAFDFISDHLASARDPKRVI